MKASLKCLVPGPGGDSLLWAGVGGSLSLYLGVISPGWWLKVARLLRCVSGLQSLENLAGSLPPHSVH